jgi:hypothetical protein
LSSAPPAGRAMRRSPTHTSGSVNLSYEPFVQEGDRVRVFGNQLELVNP